jgi:hypothetical protein
MSRIDVQSGQMRIPVILMMRKIKNIERLRPFTISLLLGFLIFSASNGLARSTTTDFTRYAMQLRRKAILRISPHLIMNPTQVGVSLAGFRDSSKPSIAAAGNWKLKIATTVFWVGEQATVGNPVSNDKSAWDGGWFSRYGGYDNPNPEARVNFIPAKFLPRQNPFYVALPYNDVEEHRTKPEASKVIPWFKNAYARDGQSVCKGRWIAIRKGNRICYAQWEDVGPFSTDDWPYVFGNKAPKPNRNQNAGLDVSPAVRDFLCLGGLDLCDWKFVDFNQVSQGPWTRYGDNNTFVRLRRQGAQDTIKYASESDSQHAASALGTTPF